VLLVPGRCGRGAHTPFDAFELASDAVARGNRKVFAEIGLQFARYLHDCDAELQPDSMPFAAFLDGLRTPTNAELEELLARFEPAGGALDDCRAEDWRSSRSGCTTSPTSSGPTTRSRRWDRRRSPQRSSSAFARASCPTASCEGLGAPEGAAVRAARPSIVAFVGLTPTDPTIDVRTSAGAPGKAA
jgi:hypothetical protein